MDKTYFNLLKNFKANDLSIFTLLFTKSELSQFFQLADIRSRLFFIYDLKSNYLHFLKASLIVHLSFCESLTILTQTLK